MSGDTRVLTPLPSHPDAALPSPPGHFLCSPCAGVRPGLCSPARDVSGPLVPVLWCSQAVGPLSPLSPWSLAGQRPWCSAGPGLLPARFPVGLGEGCSWRPPRGLANASQGHCLWASAMAGHTPGRSSSFSACSRGPRFQAQVSGLPHPVQQVQHGPRGAGLCAVTWAPGVPAAWGTEGAGAGRTRTRL